MTRAQIRTHAVAENLRLLFLVLASFFTFLERADAATFACSTEPGAAAYYEKDGYGWIEGIPTDRPYCRKAVMSGPIDASDARAFKEFLRAEPYTRVLQVHSPGGSVEAAIEIGRVVRSRFMIVETADFDTKKNRALCRSLDHARETLSYDLVPYDSNVLHPDPVVAEEARRKHDARKRALVIDQPRFTKFQQDCARWRDCRVGERCCLSACALVFVGSVYWDMANIGLHRPSLRELGSGYDETTAQLQKAQQVIRDYLAEMSVPGRVFEAMMQVPPDAIQLLDKLTASALFFGHSNDERAWEKHRDRAGADIAPSVYDWAIRSCPQDRERRSCLGDLIRKEFVRRAGRPIQ